MNGGPTNAVGLFFFFENRLHYVVRPAAPLFGALAQSLERSIRTCSSRSGIESGGGEFVCNARGSVDGRVFVPGASGHFRGFVRAIEM